jgi:hypothetical protein
MPRFVLLWVAGAFAIAISISPINLIRFYRLAHEGVATRGVVTALAPRNHRAIYYSFGTEGNQYAGIGRAGFGNPPFELIYVGEEVLIYYMPEEPRVFCLGYPDELLKNEMIPIILASVTFPPVILLAWIWQYPGFRHWLARN